MPAKKPFKDEAPKRYSDISGEPQIKNIHDTVGGDWYKSIVTRTNRKKGAGYGKTGEAATDEAFTNAGGKVNPKGKFPK